MWVIPELLLEIGALLDGSGVDWAVCGGFALDLFLGRETRVHGDLDLAVPEEARQRISRHMSERDWQVYEFRGQGRLRPLDDGVLSESGRNLMCVREGCELVTFWPCDEPGMVLHEWHSDGIRTLNYVEFLFHDRAGGQFLFAQGVARELDRAVVRIGGIPCLAPELVLLYKAAQPERPANRADFAAVFSAMDGERQAWFLRSLGALYPTGHPWAKEG